MDWLELLLPIIKDLVIIVAIAVLIPAVKAGVGWWKNLTMEAWIKELIIDGVLFVQEKYWEKSGQQKFELAKVWIIEQLNEKGINVSEEWLDALIDAVVKQLRAEFGDEDWYRA